MPKNVNLDPVLKHIAKKLIEDRQKLGRILETRETQGLREFEEQECLLDHIQAGVRALDVLEGRVRLDGAATEERKGKLAPVAGPVDMEKLAEALRPNGAAH